MFQRTLVLAVLGLPVCEAPSSHGVPPVDVAPSRPKESVPTRGWLKGQLHLHSDASGDSQTPADEVARWYADRGYDFIVFTDHNRITMGPMVGEMLVLPGVEITQNLARCSPAPAPGYQCLLHVNALAVEPDRGPAATRLAPPTSGDRVAHYTHAIDVTHALGGVAQLNHPNFHYGADAEQIRELTRRGLVLFEVANEAWDSNNEGDATHPSTTEIWDTVLTDGGRLYGTATDDAHHYGDAERLRARGEPVFTGDRGFVMVRAERNADAIREALSAGDFYASTGVLLRDVTFDGGVLNVVVDQDEPCEIAFVVDGGVEAERVDATAATFDARGFTYVRAIVTARDGRRAWVQPRFLDEPSHA